MKKILFLVPLLFLVLGCADKKEANKSNFADALDEYYQKRCILISTKKSATIDPQFSFKSGERYGTWHVGDVDKYDYLTKLGLYKKSQKNGNILYNITSKGEKVFTTYEHNIFHGICVGNYEIDKITNFTKPANMLGRIASNVQFVSRVANKVDFAKSEEFKKLFKGSLFKNTPNKMLMILTDNGWVSVNTVR